MEEQYGPDRTILTLAFVRKDDANEANPDANEANPDVKSDSIEEMILGYIREDPKTTQKQIAAKAGVSRATIQRAMKNMADKGILIRIGATRGYWQIRK